mmetsp:Transcript_61036/g.138048  ORF Transcript_61036/g.138048 Transcript_61036/m.138048 type:complete len:314 (-) Transcript_61036:2823-3764(-)
MVRAWVFLAGKAPRAEERGEVGQGALQGRVLAHGARHHRHMGRLRRRPWTRPRRRTVRRVGCRLGVLSAEASHRVHHAVQPLPQPRLEPCTRVRLVLGRGSGGVLPAVLAWPGALLCLAPLFLVPPGREAQEFGAELPQFLSRVRQRLLLVLLSARGLRPRLEAAVLTCAVAPPAALPPAAAAAGRAVRGRRRRGRLTALRLACLLLAAFRGRVAPDGLEGGLHLSRAVVEDRPPAHGPAHAPLLLVAPPQLPPHHHGPGPLAVPRLPRRRRRQGSGQGERHRRGPRLLAGLRGGGLGGGGWVVRLRSVGEGE